MIKHFLRAVVLGVAFYHFYIAFMGVPEPQIVRPIHVTYILFLGYLSIPFRGGQHATDSGYVAPWIDWVFALVSVAATAYILIDYERIVWRLPYLDELTTLDWILGGATILLTLELTRRAVGISLPILVLLFASFTIFGKYLPGPFANSGVEVEKVLDHLFLTSKGIYGSLTGLSLSVVFMFVAFGAFLQEAGGSEFLSKIILAMTRKTKGGPAKAAVVGSILFGCITGSGAANVYATGCITIPLMKKAGYRPEFAAATEACASQLGQLLPPVMGAAAFLIAEFSEISYGRVAAAAIVPSIFYVFSLYFAVHIESLKRNIGIYHDPSDPGHKVTAGDVFKDYGHLLIPLVVLVALLVEQYTAYYAATVATVSVIPVSWLRRHTRMKIKQIETAVRLTVERVMSIGIVLVCANIGIAVLDMTGVPYKVTGLLIELSGGYMIVVLLIVAAITIILGFGMSVVGAFLVASLFGAPALMEFGLEPFTAYMFIFLYALTANITPPVCIATFAAASLAECSFMKAGIRGLLLGAPSYIIPLIIAFNPVLLNIFGQGFEIGALAFINTLVSVTGMVILMAGWFLAPLNLIQRGLLIVAIVSIVMPSMETDILAAAAVAVVMLWQWSSNRRARTTATPVQ